MADIQKVLCCASSGQKCVSCQSSCSCAEGPCQCSSADLPTLQATPCAGSNVTKACGDVCACHSQCPCRKAGCGNSGLDVNLCSDGAGGNGVSCTMPGNCGCNKGSIGKL